MINNEFINYIDLYKDYILCNDFSNIITYVKMEDNNNDIYYSTHQVINDKINYLITLNDTLFINDIFYQFDNTDISFILYDYLFVLNNYIINHFHQYYNNL